MIQPIGKNILVKCPHTQEEYRSEQPLNCLPKVGRKENLQLGKIERLGTAYPLRPNESGILLVIGDFVLFGELAGKVVEKNGIEYILLREDEIDGIMIDSK